MATRHKTHGWKRGARPGNYTDMQRNIACRIRNGFGEDGCSYVKQAAISLGYLPKRSCRTTWEESICHGEGASGSAIGAYGQKALSRIFGRK